MLIVVLLIGALIALDVLAWFFGVDSRPVVSDDHISPTGYPGRL